MFRDMASAMGSMSADMKPGFPFAVIAGLKQFKISWKSPNDGMPEGTWLTWFGANNPFREGEYYYHEGIEYTSLREEGDQVRFDVLPDQTFATDSTFETRMKSVGFISTVRSFFTDVNGFTVVPAGNDRFYFVSIADSKRWMILSKN